MSARLQQFVAVVGILLGGLVLGTSLLAAAPSIRPIEGLREYTPEIHALVNARVVVAPGKVLDKATVVIRDGSIVSVGEGQTPPEARVSDLSGKTIYAGLIDAFTEVEVDAAATRGGASHWNHEITPQLDVTSSRLADTALNKKLRSQGIAARLVAPAGRILKGFSAVVLTDDSQPAEVVVKDKTAAHLRLTVSPRRERDDYPSSPMGAVALARQTFYDADWYGRAWKAYEADTSLPQPERDAALAALDGHVAARGLFICDASNELFVLRADQFAREFSLNMLIRGSGHEYKRLDAIRETGRSVIVPVDFPKPPNVATAEAALAVDLSELMHWELAPENPARLEAAGVRIALTTYGLEDAAGFLKGVRQAVRRGLPADAALAAVTTTPARLLGVDAELGTVEPSKHANLVVTDGDLFDAKTKVLETWVRGVRFEVETEPQLDLRGEWSLTLLDQKQPSTALLLSLEGKPVSLTGEMKLGPAAKESDDGEAAQPSSLKLDRVGIRGGQFSCTFPGEGLLGDGVVRLTAVVMPMDDDGHCLEGALTLADGERIVFLGKRLAAAKGAADEVAAAEEHAGPEGSADDTSADDVAEHDGATETAAKHEAVFPLGSVGLSELPEQPAAVLFRNATIWTLGEQGVMENASVLVEQGRIVAVGHDLEGPSGAVMVDLKGKHVTPGIIDCHSHMATDGGVNEGTQAITAEVRIGDFIDSDDITIYRQLAGGVTSANVLHGSANPIGGQNQVIKLRWGGLPEEMKFAGAPQGIKFALGENVKQANWGDQHTTRYPQTRMGVEQLMRDALNAAREYRQAWQRWEQTGRGLPPRRDLELDALAEIVAGERWIHCHSYRQDEILALLRTLDEFGITIGSFQHILEGYKVADAMAEHGAMGSAFSDWWAYKFEVFDAIPYAGALMHNAGVVVSFNSDDRELGRHLNQEAAKAVKYGGVDPVEALKFVTLNPAKQLRIDHQVGSVEVGKDADLVVWSGEPLAITSRVEQTWIDGRRYFAIDEDREMRRRDALVRNSLVQKILDSGEAMASDDEKRKDESELWPREDIFCHGHDHGHTHVAK